MIDYSLVQTLGPDPAVSAALAAGTNNLVGVDPLLGPLADNGGITLTHLPGEASPVIDAGSTVNSGVPGLDQRDQDRIDNLRVDIGSVERNAGDVVLAATGTESAPVFGAALLLLLMGLGLTGYRVSRIRRG